MCIQNSCWQLLFLVCNLNPFNETDVTSFSLQYLRNVTNSFCCRSLKICFNLCGYLTPGSPSLWPHQFPCDQCESVWVCVCVCSEQQRGRVCLVLLVYDHNLALVLLQNYNIPTKSLLIHSLHTAAQAVSSNILPWLNCVTPRVIILDMVIILGLTYGKMLTLFINAILCPKTSKLYAFRVYIWSNNRHSYEGKCKNHGLVGEYFENWSFVKSKAHWSNSHTYFSLCADLKKLCFIMKLSRL